MNRVAQISLKVAEWRIQEDVYPRTPTDQMVLDSLSHWDKQRDYDGPEWGGIEYFNFCLAKVARRVAVEFPAGSAWYTYDTSTRGKPDGKDWRLVVLEPEDDSVTVVNCHSIVHDESWTLTKTVYSTDEIDVGGLVGISHSDPWVRSMLWTIAVVRGLGGDGYRYEEAEKDMMSRLEMGLEVNMRLPALRSEVSRLHEELFNKPDQIPLDMTTMVSKWRLPEGKIGSFRRPDEDSQWGIMTISPNAFDKNMVDGVLKHELCHAAVGKDPNGVSHGEKFLALADALGIPQKWQD